MMELVKKHIHMTVSYTHLIWAAAGALLTGCKAAGGSGTGNGLRPLELSSLEYTGRLELEYAEQFAVDLYQDGFQVLTVADGSRRCV